MFSSSVGVSQCFSHMEHTRPHRGNKWSLVKGAIYSERQAILLVRNVMKKPLTEHSYICEERLLRKLRNLNYDSLGESTTVWAELDETF
jgi:hypothetical protein